MPVIKEESMIQEIAPHIYYPEYKNKRPKPDSYALFFKDNKILLKGREELSLFRFGDFGESGEIYEKAVFICAIDRENYFFVPDSEPQGENWKYYPLFSLRSFDPLHEAFGAVLGSQMYRFVNSRKFCGYCGNRAALSSTERAMVCGSCGSIEYPKICSAIIVAVRDMKKNKLVLVKNANKQYPYYALIAGYMEIGETPEDALRREVREEVGLNVKNIRSYKSQPWPFSDTLMLGFTAEVDGDTTIVMDEGELSFAGWFSPEEVPEPEYIVSVGQEMIKAFKDGLL